MSNRGVQVGGVMLLTGVGYYLYSAGGNPKVAEKQFEADVSKASAKVKSEIPGRAKEAEKQTDKWTAEAKAKADSMTDKARAELQKAEAYGIDAKDSAMKKINEIDRSVEKEAAKAKSGISGWFGGK